MRGRQRGTKLLFPQTSTYMLQARAMVIDGYKYTKAVTVTGIDVWELGRSQVRQGQASSLTCVWFDVLIVAGTSSSSRRFVFKMVVLNRLPLSVLC